MYFGAELRGYLGYGPDTPPTDCGEGGYVGYAPATGLAVGDVCALAANSGDDPHTLVVVEVADYGRCQTRLPDTEVH
jgi:hypothetical protein